MKKLLLALLFISLPFSVDAQVKDTLNKELKQDLRRWGGRYISLPISVDAQVKDTLNKELNQDLMKIKKTKRTGCILFAAGISVTLIGINMMDNSIECYPTYPSTKCDWSEVKGVGALVAGLTLSSIGTVIWIMAKRNENIYKHRRYSLIPSASINGLGLKIRF